MNSFKNKSQLKSFLSAIALLTSLSATSQYLSGTAAIGAYDLKSEFTEGILDLSSVAPEYSLTASYNLKNERWNIILEGSYYSGQQAMPVNGNNQLTTQFTGYSLMAGSRYILISAVDDVNYYPGMVIPFAGLTAGATFSSATVNQESDAAYIIKQSDIAPCVEAQLGMEVVIMDRLRAMVWGGLRYSITSDYLDGVSSAGSDFNDYLLRAAVGITYDITQNPADYTDTK